MATYAYSLLLTSCKTKFTCYKVCLVASLSRLSFPPLKSLGYSIIFVHDGPIPYVSPLSSFSSEVSGSRDRTKGSYSNNSIIFLI